MSSTLSARARLAAQPTAEQHLLMARVRDALHAAYLSGEEGNRKAFAIIDGEVHRLLLGTLAAPAPAGPWEVVNHGSEPSPDWNVIRVEPAGRWCPAHAAHSRDEAVFIRDALNTLAARGAPAGGTP